MVPCVVWAKAMGTDSKGDGAAKMKIEEDMAANGGFLVGVEVDEMAKQ